MNLEERLSELLKNFRYNSRHPYSFGEQKGLQDYHIEALKKDLLPFIEEEINKIYISCGRFNIVDRNVESEHERILNDPWLNL